MAASPGLRPAAFLRALGLRERCLYRYSERNPLLFVLAAEFEAALDADLVGDALYAVQRRHPLLSAHVKDDPDTGLGFYRADSVASIGLTFLREPDDQDWQAIAAQELTQPFDSAAAPLMRATLVAQRNSSTLLLTFDHVAADGISSVLVLNDLLAALNGHPPPVLPLPESLEELATRRFDAVQIAAMSTDAGDPRMGVPASIRAFDASRPYLYRVAMGHDATARLVERCREEHTTVHAAIVAAASCVRSAACGEDFVRTYSPINARNLVAQGAGCCLAISFACTGLAPADGSGFWDQARETGDQLSVARSAAGLMLGSAVIEEYFPIDADCGAAEHFLCTMLPFELTITNLGVQSVPRFGPIRPRAIWGPVVLTQIEGEYVTGVVTYDGQLRMTTCGHTPTARFLESVCETLMAES
ncbi:peptide synthetase [Mycobacterium colombiense]|uniref:Peptide synthetase n=1 Tax=Mycobacterium colombiense TaxID=339268 RepID=A0A329KHF3_9MYCO|nr:peptide synthetase [Mycobacterium colombiense]